MPTDRDRPRRWWLAPTIGMVVLVTAVAALSARTIYQQPAATGSSLVLPSAATSAPPGSEPGGRTVSLTQDVYNYPARTEVQQLLQAIFDAINNRRYDDWRAQVTLQRSAEEPEATWVSSYRSTRDGTIVVYRVDPSPGNGLRVYLGFTSVQDVRDAPPDFPHGCIRWRVVWPLAMERGGWKLDVGTVTSTPMREAC